MLLIEAYMATEARVYLKKNLQRQAAWADPLKGVCKGTLRPTTPTQSGESTLDLVLLFNKPRPKGLSGRCFGCGQPGH